MNRILCSIVCVALAGCGVSKTVYQEQTTRSQELQARVSDLEGRLASESGRRETLERVIEDRKAELGGLLSKHDQDVARNADLEIRLSSCSQREDGLRADLEGCRKARTSSTADVEKLRAETERLRMAYAQDVEGCRGEAEELKAERSKTDRENREKLDALSRTYEGLAEAFREEVAKGRITVSQFDGKLSVNIMDEIMFDSGSANLKPDGRQVLERLGKVLKEMKDKEIVIEGHTDNVRITGELAKKFPSNWELSSMRAASVVRHLEENVGIGSERLSAMGFGPTRPLVSNDTPQGRQRNRRIEIRLIPAEPKRTSPADGGSGQSRTTREKG